MGSLSIFQLHRRLTVHLCISFGMMLLLSVCAAAQTLATSVPLLLPSAIAFDSGGNLYIAETGNNVVRKVDGAGFISTFAGTGAQGYDGDGAQAASSLLDSPQGLAISATSLYIADTHNHRIRKVDLQTGIVTTIAGSATTGATGDNGLASSATMDRPVALALDSKNNLFIADSGSHRIRRVDANTGMITTVAGSGTQGYEGENALAVTALLDSPQGIAVDAVGNIYLADTHNHRIRRIDAATGLISTLAGTGVFGYAGDSASSTTVRLALPQGLSVDSQGNIYFADTQNHRLRRIDGTTGVITAFAGDGTQEFAGDGKTPTSASLDNPRFTALSPSSLVTTTDTGNQRVRQISGDSIQTIAGLGTSVPVKLSINGDAVIFYGSGKLTAILDSATAVTGKVTFMDQYAGLSGVSTVVPISSNAAVLDTTGLPAGVHTLTASYGGDPTHAAAQSADFSLSINQLPLTVIVAPSSLSYGEAIPSINGTLGGVLARDQSNISVSFSTNLPVHPSVGTYPVAVALAGPAAGNYTLAVSPLLTITRASTVTTLTATTATLVSASSVEAGQPVLLSVHVASTTTGTPAGTIILSDGGTLLAAGNATSSGDLTFATSSLGAGPHSLVAAYAGNENFLSSTSPTTLFTVGTPQAGPADFTLASSSATTQTIISGSSASFSFVVNTQGDLTSPVTLSATGLPDLATAAFNPGSITPGTTSGSFTMTVATPKTAQLGRRTDPAILAFLLLPFATWCRRGIRRPLQMRLVALFVCVSLLLFTGCGDRIRTGNSVATPTKSYIITVTGTAIDNAGAILRHTATVTLTLQAAS